MAKHKINNFCNGAPIEIDGHGNANHGALVSIEQHHGAMNFQHSMRPDQAREMALLLHVAADEAEADQYALKAKVAA